MKYLILFLLMIFTTTIHGQNETPPKIDSVSITEIKCYGTNTGTVTVWVSWKLGAKSLTYYCDNLKHNTSGAFNEFNNLSAGNHTVKVVYKNLADSVVVTISQPLQLTDTCSGNIQCSGNSGTVTVNVSGGTPGYSYLWTDSSGSQKGIDSSVSGLSAGTYMVTVTDANQCQETCTVPLIPQVSSTPTHKVGDSISCGYIFYVDQNFDSTHPCSTRYLVCAKKDQNPDGTWYNNTYKYQITNATTDELFDKSNADIIDTLSFAARVCADYISDSLCTGWYLPSVVELDSIYTNLAAKGVGGFAQRGYWSSVEGSKSHTAWAVDFDTSNKQQVIPTRISPNGRAIQRDKSNKSPVRAVCEIWIKNQ